ncbi:angiotensin-converting enzyme-like [Dermacentor variabilis]|uniref:angiotensin-converting enzyme-like n=1 Tax=Dermacentor variabilis TaxID=34621 RepID=UPI003F5B3CD7
MKRILPLVLCAMISVAGSACQSERCDSKSAGQEEAAAERYLTGELESAQNRMCADIATALWNYNAEPSELSAVSLTETLQHYSAFQSEVWSNATRFNWTSFTNSTLRRAFSKLSLLGKNALDDENLAKYLRLEALLSGVRSNVTLCQYKGGWKDGDESCRLTFSDLQRIVSLSENSAELLHYFKQRMKQARRFGDAFSELLRIIAMESEINGFRNAADYVMNSYEWPTFREDAEAFWNKLLPLYQRMHRLVRERLIRKYGSKIVSPSGPIHVHLLGVQGYLTSNAADLTDPLTASTWNDENSPVNSKSQNVTAFKAFKDAEYFYVSLGLPQLPRSVWEKSMIATSSSRDADFSCEASAWDFCDGQDYRIRICTEATVGSLGTVFHEMGHVYYFMLYAELPHVFRTGANAAFHEAVADALSWLAIQSRRLREHLGVGITDPAAETHHLLALAFDHVGQLFHGIATSKWMWTVLDEPVARERMDSLYWDMRLKYEGIRSPSDTQTGSFRSPADYDFRAHMNRIRSMCSFVVQMQIVKYLCGGANRTGPLHECDVFGSEDAGRRLVSILRLGSSKPLADLMEMISEGQRKTMDASATLEYFLPVMEWMQDNSESHVGWGQHR